MRYFSRFFNNQQNRGNISAISLQSCEYFCVICIMLTNHQPPQPGKIVGMFLQVALCAYTTQPPQPAKLWEYFCDFVASMGIYFLVLHCACTRQNRGNISAILLQLWEYISFCRVGVHTQPTSRQNRGSISVRFRCLPWEYLQVVLPHTTRQKSSAISLWLLHLSCGFGCIVGGWEL